MAKIRLDISEKIKMDSIAIDKISRLDLEQNLVPVEGKDEVLIKGFLELNGVYSEIESEEKKNFEHKIPVHISLVNKKLDLKTLDTKIESFDYVMKASDTIQIDAVLSVEGLADIKKARKKRKSSKKEVEATNKSSDVDEIVEEFTHNLVESAEEYSTKNVVAKAPEDSNFFADNDAEEKSEKLEVAEMKKEKIRAFKSVEECETASPIEDEENFSNKWISSLLSNRDENFTVMKVNLSEKKEGSCCNVQ